MDTVFYYNGGCGIPSLKINGCHPVFEFGGYSISDLGCSIYTTNVPSHAALQNAWITGTGGWFSYWVWQRRECYTDHTQCNWHTDQG